MIQTYRLDQVYNDYEDFSNDVDEWADYGKMTFSNSSKRLLWFILVSTFWRRDIAYSQMADFKGALYSIAFDVILSYDARYKALTSAYNLPATEFVGYKEQTTNEKDGDDVVHTVQSSAQSGLPSSTNLLDNYVDNEAKTETTIAKTTQTREGLGSLPNDINSISKFIDNGWKELKRALSILFVKFY